MTRPREISELLRSAQRQGWSYRRGKHHILTSPTGRRVVLPVSPRGTMYLRGVMKELRKAGFINEGL